MSKTLYLGVDEVNLDNGAKLSEVAKWMENGTELSPPRPYNRMGMERAIKQCDEQIKAFMKNMFKSGIQKGAKGKGFAPDREQVLLTTIGKAAVKHAKAVIKNAETVPNAPSTVAKKGFNHPLFHKGLLLSKVNYLVE